MFAKALERKFQKDYSPKSYLDRYLAAYYLFQILSIFIALCLAIASYKFWESLFAGKAEWLDAAWAGGITTGLYAVAVVIIGNVIFKAVHAKDEMHWILPVFWALLLCGDVAANVWGIPELTKQMMPSPTDLETPLVNSSFDNLIGPAELEKTRLDGQILRLEKAKGNGFKVRGGSSHWMGNITKFGSRELLRLGKLRDNKETEVANLRLKKSNQLTAAGTRFQTAVDAHDADLKSKTLRLKWLQAVFYLFFIAFTYWSHHFGATVAAQYNGTSPIPAPPAPPGPGSKRSKTLANPSIPRRKSKRNGTPKPGAGGRVISLRPTGRVGALHAAREAIAKHTHLNGQGFAITCTHCGTQALHKRKPNPGEMSFCSSDCRYAYHDQQRKNKDKDLIAI